MLISFNWLKNYLNLKKISPRQLVEHFNSLGLSTENFLTVNRYLDNILVARITDIEKHPRADRLQIATVTDGKNQYRIVCGAPNISPGDIVPLALPGAKIQGEVLKEANIRGINSAGMLCSARELGIGDDQRGIWQLPKNWRVGKPLKFYVPETDYLYELEIPPNRPDCLGYIGIARELSVKLNEQLKLPRQQLRDLPGVNFSLKINSLTDCSYYLAIAFDQVRVADSPAWMQLALISSGIRPINNIVDITNYVLLEYGQPLHAFDRRQLKNDRIIVRRANPGEKLILLDEQELSLTPNDLIIADGEKPLALAGVMGGKFSGISEETTEVILESAVFAPPLIRQSRQRFNLNTEASYRFERGANPLTARLAAERAAVLIKDIAGGKITAIKLVAKKIPATPWIKIPRHFINDFGSIPIKKSVIWRILKQLNYQVKIQKNNFYLKPPAYRQDIQQSADVVEEVCRHYGYQHIQEKSLPIVQIPEKNSLWELTRYLRQKLITLGVSEITTNPLISEEEWLNAFPASPAKIIRLSNPTSVFNSCLRPNLLTGLLRVSEESVNENISRKYFEIGTVFIDEQTEENHLGIILSGKTGEINWLSNEDFTFYHLKGILEHILHFVPSQKFLPEYDRIDILSAGKKIGLMRQIKNNFYAEINLNEVIPHYRTQKKSYQPFSQFPRVSLDLAFRCPKNKTYQEVKDRLIAFLKDRFLEEIYLFDTYQGENIGEDKKSFAFRLTFRSFQGTLTSEIINKTINDLLEYLRPYNIELRGEIKQ